MSCLLHSIVANLLDLGKNASVVSDGTIDEKERGVDGQFEYVESD